MAARRAAVLVDGDRPGHAGGRGRRHGPDHLAVVVVAEAGGVAAPVLRRDPVPAAVVGVLLGDRLAGGWRCDHLEDPSLAVVVVLDGWAEAAAKRRRWQRLDRLVGL